MISLKKRDDAFLIWSDALTQLSIGQPPDWRQKGKRCQTHMTCIDQWIILAYMQILLDFRAIRFKFHDRINQWSIRFQSVIPRTTQGDKRFCASWQSTKLCPNSNKCPWLAQGAYFWLHARSAYQRVKISQGLPIDVPNHLLCTKHHVRINHVLPIDAPYNFYYFQHAHHHVRKAWGSRSMLHTASITFSTRIAAYEKARGSRSTLHITSITFSMCITTYKK
jgi:hypothetical protein